jgi:nifR3 family TIM-barrel protein
MINFGFWKKAQKKAQNDGRPLFVLAPMADVTDAAFRKIIAAKGKPDALWTEFVSADGLAKADKKGKERLARGLVFSRAERPVVAQFFTATPEHLRLAAAQASKLGFDGVDINMGCPDKAIERQGAGASLMKTPQLARELIRAAKAGAPKLPISVKTRIGWNKNELETWLPELLAETPAVITVHARTRKEMSKVPADWSQVGRAVKMRDEIQKDLPAGERTLIFGNGDAVDLADAKAKVAATGADGVMFGRAIFGNPWLFTGRPAASVTPKEKLTALIEHVKAFNKLLGKVKYFAVMKKHFKAYINGWPGAVALRSELMQVENAAQAVKLLTAAKRGFII